MKNIFVFILLFVTVSISAQSTVTIGTGGEGDPPEPLGGNVDLTPYQTVTGTTGWDKDASDDFSGNYADLSGLPIVPSLLSELTNDVGFITSPNDADSDPTNEIQDLSPYQLISGTANWDKDVNDDFDGNYNSLINLPTIPTLVSQLTNDAGFITSPDDADNDPTNEIQDLTPYQTITGTANWDKDATDDFDGNYANLTNTPAIPTLLSQLTNDPGFITDPADDDADPTNEIQTLTITYTDVDASFLATAGVTGDGNEPNQLMTLSSTRLDTGWSLSGNQLTYTGTPDKVHITVNLVYDDGGSSLKQRIAPELQVLRNGTKVVESATGYQRHFNSHANSSNNIAITDGSPGTNPVYTIIAQQGSTQNDLLNITDGWFTADAIEKITVPLTITISN